MRTASMTLGIIGGIIALLLSFLLLFGGATFLNTSLWKDAYDSTENFNGTISESEFIEHTTAGGTIFLVTGICSAIAGILGLVGGIIVNRKNVTAGVMMIIAAAFSVFGFFNLVSIILFIVGGVFALRREPQNAVPPYPPPPSYAYQPYQAYPPSPQQPAPPYFGNPPVPPKQ